MNLSLRIRNLWQTILIQFSVLFQQKTISFIISTEDKLIHYKFQSIDLVCLSFDKKIGYIVNMVIDVTHYLKFLIVEHNLIES